MAENSRFIPVYGTETEISSLKKVDGRIYFASDSEKIYLDMNGERLTMGGNGVSLYYANQAEVEQNLDNYFILTKDAFEENIKIKENDLILNIDGSFYRVLSIKDNEYICMKLTISGGGGGGSNASDVTFFYNNLTIGPGAVYIYQKDYNIEFWGTSKEDTGVSMTITIKQKIEKNGQEQEITLDNIYVAYLANNEKYLYNAKNLPKGKGISIEVVVTSSVGSTLPRIFKDLSTFDFELKIPVNSTYRGSTIREENFVDLPFESVSNGRDQQLHVIIDKESLDLTSTSDLGVFKDPAKYEGPQSIRILKPRYTNNNTNIIELYMTTLIGRTEFKTNTLTYEVAWKPDDNTADPVIWFGAVPNSVLKYDTVIIPFMVYDPVNESNQRSTEVKLYHNGKEIPGASMQVPYRAEDWYYWNVTSYYTANNTAQGELNTFTLQCGKTIKSVNFYVSSLGAKNLDLVDQNNLILNLNAEGRSNSESNNTIDVLSYKYKNQDYSVKFNNFNWYNNGWMENSNHIPYLSIANGANIEVPIPEILLNDGEGVNSYTIEARFEVKNIQAYSTLVTIIPYYQASYPDGTGSGYYTVEQIKALGLVYAKDEDGNKIMDPDSPKQENPNGPIAIKALNANASNKGFCLGTQEAYFKDTNVVNVRYKENEIINISFVVSASQHKVSIYLNGLLSGILSLGSSFLLPNKILFNSDYCDLDLYSFRIYNKELTMAQVVQNYIADTKSVELFDENNLTNVSDATVFSYSKMLNYNLTHPDEPLMPYAVIEISDNINQTKDPNDVTHAKEDDRLPFEKGKNRYCTFTFKNPTLDRLYDLGEVSDDVYLKSSPSFIASGVDINVQGTSSKIYPRRNFKIKLKKAGAAEDETFYWKYTNGPQKDQQLKKYYLDSENKNCKTNKFCLKADYMESSGTYNTGFANLMGLMYNHHPLGDYSIEGLDSTGYRTSVYGFPILLFHKHSTPTDLEIDKNEGYSDSVYEYIGRYNFNLDKSSNEYYGFEIEKEQMNLDLSEEDWVYFKDKDGKFEVNEQEGTFTEEEIAEFHYTKKVRKHPTFKEVAECWELEDNKGTWTSFRYPSSQARTQGFGYHVVSQGEDQKLDVSNAFEARYNAEEDKINVAMGHDADDPNAPFFTESGWTAKNNFVIKKTKNLEKLFNWLDSTDTLNCTGKPLDLYYTEYNLPKDELVNGKYLSNNKTVYYRVGMFPPTEEDLEEEASSNWIKWFIDADGNPLVRLKTVQNYNQNAGGIEVINGRSVETNEYYYPDSITNIDMLSTESMISPEEIDNYRGLLEILTDVKEAYDTDTPEFRLAKFKQEFTKHLNLDYCLVYFILTELLLCYDSRGKNMMMASWGPQEKNGEYIWYPIFYDIDTQLGLNNIGAPLWDYDVDASEEGTFSTAESVLWQNFYSCFRTNIEQKYQSMRRTNLTESKIEGAYLCDPNTFINSYAMRGKRPVIAYDLDEWYKYLAPSINKSSTWTDPNTMDRRYGFYPMDSSDDITKASKTVKNYDYVCQGNRKLSRELLIRNRLNFLDSRWLAEEYGTFGQQYQNSIAIRANANDPNTSDNLLENNNKDGYNTYSLDNYPPAFNCYNANPDFQIKPFLSEYLTVFYDESPLLPTKKFKINDEYVEIKATASVEKGYQQVAPYNEQLIYIPGGDYLSSLGDLSLKYPSMFKLGRGARLTELLLGSDYPDYRNGILGSKPGTFDLEASDQYTNQKVLMQKIILTNITGLKGDLNINSCVKLQEFRALNTQLETVTFASGAPLKTVHLPKSISKLTLNNSKSLVKILTSKPKYYDYDPDITSKELREYTPNLEDKTGLYIEGITDYNEEDENLTNLNTNFSQLNLNNVNLGYGSWIILSNMLSIWQKKASELKRRLIINLQNVNWNPYSLLPKDSIFDKNNNQYYELTVHNTFKHFDTNQTNNTEEKWNNLLFNNKIFEYHPELNDISNTLSSTEFLDLFINSYDEVTSLSDNYFASSASTISYPKLTGEIFINNTEPFNELELENYRTYFPDLKIYFNNITPSNTLVFIVINALGQEDQYDQIRFDIEKDHPDRIISSQPSKLNWVFKGWALNPEPSDSSEFLALYDDTKPEEEQWTYNYDLITFTEDTRDYNVYAIFEIEKFAIEFKSPVGYNQDISKITYFDLTQDNNPIYVEYNQQLYVPDYIFPYTDSSNLSLDKYYKFVGWTEDPTKCFISDTNLLKDTVIQVERISAKDPHTFYACYIVDTVRDNATDSKYFNISKDSNNRIILKPKKNVILGGKVTIPYQIQDPNTSETSLLNVQYLSEFEQTKITHLYFHKDYFSNSPSDQPPFYFASRLFVDNKTLTYIDFPPRLRLIGSYCFNRCVNLNFDILNFTTIANRINNADSGCKIDTSAFVAAGNDLKSFGSSSILILPSSISEFSSSCFMNIGYQSSGKGTLQFGQKESNKGFNTLGELNAALGTGSNLFYQPVNQTSGDGRWNKIEIYYNQSTLNDDTAKTQIRNKLSTNVVTNLTNIQFYPTNVNTN